MSFSKRLEQLEYERFEREVIDLRMAVADDLNIPGELERVNALFERVTDPPPPGWQPDPEHVEIIRAAFPDARDADVAITEALWRAECLRKRGEL